MTVLGRFGRRFAEEHFGLSAMAERLAIVYDEALTHYRGATGSSTSR